MEKLTGTAHTQAQEVHPRAGLWGEGIQNSDQHPLGQTITHVTISKPHNNFFPSLVFVLSQGTAFFKVLSAWTPEDF